MRVAIIGASGRAGSRIVDELVRRHHHVTAIARSPDKVAPQSNVDIRQGDILNVEAVVSLLFGHDAVVSAVQFSASDPQLLIEAVRASEVRRYLVVGGAGSLEVAPGVKYMDTPEFPERSLGESRKGAEFLELLRKETQLEWTFLSPSALFYAGERTGVFRLGAEQLLVGEQGSSISFEDYAVAAVDELERPAHVRQRFTVGY